MLYTIIVILVILWLLGFIGHIAGGFIHLLIVAAVIILIYQLIVGRRAA
jgi:4-hydroxybenzoate polyprenyltransferase